jgi:hypothetical protein
MCVNKLAIRKNAYPYNENHLSVENVDPPNRKSWITHHTTHYSKPEVSYLSSGELVFIAEGLA